MTHTILLIDDEEEIRRFIRLALKAEGLNYVEASTGKEAMSVLKGELPDLVILDLGLPDFDGYSILKKIRETSKLPVLILTARDQEAEKIKLLEGGANDYLTKPFSIKELVVRVKVLLRDLVPNKRLLAIDYGKLMIDLQKHQVIMDNAPLALSKKEFALLSMLAQRAQELVSQQTLLKQIWGESHVEDSHYLRIVVSQLRKKLSDDAATPKIIETEPGVGYRFLLLPLNKHFS
ncbi:MULTISPECIES: response regulator [Pseudoalteromonas]|uniref:DNA-binding response regulator n=1 Tax=Pseudoalteromonas piscicida TaxID=43662 RepID=A0A1Z3NNP3_PSEO7|nr:MULTISPECIES: response regulator transcription factor [Pseudoalteromonas]ASD69108.1 DNA-binding response regulator [Pseudoalteromonas piscicida]ATD10079.1 two-component system, OmpR family, KDP operon response regulator KdpE [Pseudoalteromonas piscicida]AXQ99714.1 DNA-binding response regulator [Pseudoalteromonas piscicida]AXR04528.1 DNA-binding response regulator [Pseudoalteromonas piscicida]KID35264.1 transcriptional regulator [Pseudoalteromonas flavipulchra NCIMB 2033 = ATCC BAA-314]